jgi:putative ATP-dependent endonuclease of the OLD family
VDRSEFGVREVRIRGFRSARSASFSPGPLCALVGGPSVGKSNVLAAVWMLLQHGPPDPVVEDLPHGSEDGIRLEATLVDRAEIELVAGPPGSAEHRGPGLPVLFLPASARSGSLVAEPAGVELPFVADGESSAAPAAALVAAIEELCERGDTGIVLLIEEPELFLPPQRQRYLHRLLRSFAEAGNQVLYSTHSAAFLDVGRLDELALVDWSPARGTTIVHPRPLPADASFRALSELDAERSELLLARAVLLVEGRTEKLTFPFVFRALGHDADRLGISIVECGGKPNIPLFIRICDAVHVPYVAVHDRDAVLGKKPIAGERVLNSQIAELAGPERTVILVPDFEAVAGLRGRSHKPARAWERFSSIAPEDVPAELGLAVSRAVELAQS